MNKQLNKRGIIRLWIIQLATTLCIAGFFLIAYDIKASASALLGGLVYIIPSAYFASKLFKYQGARAARQIVNSFYKGEAAKIFLSMLLFTLVFALCRVTPLAFFTSYILLLMTHWISPWIIVNKQNRPESD